MPGELLTCCCGQVGWNLCSPASLMRDGVARAATVQPAPSSIAIPQSHSLFQSHEFDACFLSFDICRYCPGGPDSDFEYSTQSYTGYEVLLLSAITHGLCPVRLDLAAL